MKTPDTDNRVVDYLYDDLSDAQRSAFAEDLDDDEDAAAEVTSYQHMLELYREESEELTPSVAASERLIKEAERATRPWLSRVLGDLLPRLVMRPAMGVAMASVLIIGVGVFFVLSRDMDKDVADKSAAGPKVAESTVDRGKDRAEAPAPAKPTTFTTAVADKSRAANRPADDADREGRLDQGIAGRDKTVALGSTNGAGRGKLALDELETGAVAGRTTTEVSKDGLRRARRPRRSRRSGSGERVVSRGHFKQRASPRPRPRRRAPLPQSAANDEANAPADKQPVATAQRKLQNKAVVKPAQKKLSPSAVHNRAKKNLAKGRVALACRLFGTVVSRYHGYSHRADALLGWARCELARGSYSRAAALIRQLMREYPSWNKAGKRWLAEIQRQRNRSQLRAQRMRKRRKTKARRRAAPRRRPARQAPSSSSSY